MNGYAGKAGALAPLDEPGEMGAISGDTLATLIALVRKHTGIAMNSRKSVLLERRLRPRMEALSLRRYRDYLDMVERDRDEVPHFIDLVTTNDTLFFRTPQVWSYLQQEFLPEWWRTHAGQRLNIWSAAAASGEELYSLAMMCEEFGAQAPGFRYRILGSDISRQMLALARAGLYAGRSVEKMRASHPALFAKYFTPAGGGSAYVLDTLKHNVELVCHNLLEPLKPAQKFDLVMLRNVLIYFDQEHQETVLRQARHSMAPHARLIVGESESITGLNIAYQFERPMTYRLENESAV
jgi:chemotaxis protein methyltransferase CheR